LPISSFAKYNRYYSSAQADVDKFPTDLPTDIFLFAAEDLAVPPAACVVIGGTPRRRGCAWAGMQVVAVPDPGMDRARFASADLVIASIAELAPDDLCGSS